MFAKLLYKICHWIIASGASNCEQKNIIPCLALGSFGEKSYIQSGVTVTNPQNVFIGNDVQIQQGVILRPGKNQIVIGDRSGINPYVTIYGKVTIGKYAMIAPHVMLAGGNHAIDDITAPMILSGRGTNKGIILEDDVWIGANSVIIDGVTIGKGAVVAAGSVVTKNVNPYDVVAGNPARFLKSRKGLLQESGIEG